jgi:glutathione synthase/RimK-type ligase-like ATP-grasp enzyme
MVGAEYQASMMGMLDLLPCVVVNRAKASMSNDSKVFQSFLIQSVGLLSPRTLITTVPDEVRTFYEACERSVIYKSLSGTRSIVHRLTDDDLAHRVDRVRNCPTQFQECIQGVDVRVHTVGNQLFPTEIFSEVPDYRYAAREGASLLLKEAWLPLDVQSACFRLSEALGLAVAGIDLRRTADGSYYCFEVNPSPAFIFYERATDQPISEAVAVLLRGES